jgi:hypothetical protein
MTRMISATSIAVALSAGSVLFAAGQQTPAKDDPKIGTKITIAGCLHQGTDDKEFLLLGVTERGAEKNAISVATPATSIYWLDSNEGLKKRVGEVVEITGEVKEHSSDTGLGTITVVIDPSKTMSKDVTVSTQGASATTEKFNDRPKPARATKDATVKQTTRPVYVLAVSLVHSVAPMVPGQPCK